MSTSNKSLSEFQKDQLVATVESMHLGPFCESETKTAFQVFVNGQLAEIQITLTRDEDSFQWPKLLSD
jgi:hypothetical protein